jgi:hypothetical protein
MTPEVSKLLEQALSLSVEEQEGLADSLISNLAAKWTRGYKSQNWIQAGRKPPPGRKFDVQFDEAP